MRHGVYFEDDKHWTEVDAATTSTDDKNGDSYKAYFRNSFLHHENTNFLQHEKKTFILPDSGHKML